MESRSTPDEGAARTVWRKRVALVAAVLAALVLLVTALAPLLVSTFGRGRIEKAFAQRFGGRLEVDGLDLAWTGRQRIEGARLFDPDGVLVARFTLDLPGLWKLSWGRGRRLGRVDVLASADLVADDAGVTNLDRALAPRTVASPPPPGGGGTQPSESGGVPWETLERLEVDLDLRVERLSWSDATTRAAAGGPMIVEGFQAHVVVARGGSLQATAEGTLSGSASGELSLQAQVEHPFAAASSEQPPRVDVDLRMAELPVALIDTLSRQEGRLTELLGERITLQVRASGTPLEGDASLDLAATRARVTARAGLADGKLRALEGWALDAELDLETRALEDLLAGRLPEGVVLARTDLTAPLRLAVPRLSVPVAAALDARAQGGDLLGAVLAETELGLGATLGGWALAAPAWLGDDEPLALDEVTLDVRLVPTAGVARADVTVHARLADSPAGTLALSLGSPDLLALSASAIGVGEGRADARVELRGIPTALLERIAPAADRLQGALGPALDLDLALEGSLEGASALRGRVLAGVEAGGRRLTARLDGALNTGAGPAAPLPVLEARGELSGLELAYELLPAGPRPLVSGLLGSTLAFDLTSAAASPGASAIALQLTAARAQLALTGELAPGSFHLRGEPGLALSARPTAETLQALIGAHLPPGTALTLRERDTAVAVTVRSLDLPLAPDGAGAEAWLGQARGEFELTLPALVWQQPPAAGSGEAVSAEFDGLRALVTLAPGAGLTAHLSGAVSGQAPDAIDVRVHAPDPASLLAGGASSVPAEIDARAQGLPTALVDALAGQDGLLVDVLGPTLDLELSGRWPDPTAPLRAQLRGGGASLNLTARTSDGVLIAEEGEGLEALTRLTPLYSERIVGRLVPLLVGLSKPDDAPPVGLSLANFRLPLDGDLRGLDADVVLDLNLVAYQLLPGLRGLGSSLSEAAPTDRMVSIPPLKLAIRQGVVRYEQLPLEIGGQSLSFSGAFDLATLELDLAGEVPLSLLGSKVSAELEKVRDYIDPNVAVPIHLRGTRGAPRISIGREFLESALKHAAQGALQRGLQELLNRKKEKDG